jgi:hypothetical protein
MILLIILVYVLGCVVAYFLQRRSWLNGGCPWTIGKRNMTLFFSLFSWISVAAGLIIALADGAVNDNKPVKW